MERILCAAIHYRDLPTAGINASNVTEGVVICGCRHVHCLHQMTALTGKRAFEVGRYTEGFVTTCNRFLDRVDAGKLALSNGQVSGLKYSSDRLYSEDLY